MEEGSANPDETGTDPKAMNTMPNWIFRTILGLVLVTVVYVLLWHGLGVFSFITDRLPLLLPLAVTVMSIFTRATEIRSYEAVLKTSNDIAIGIISFDIWLLSARSEASGRVLVNPNAMIRGDFVLAFLVLGMATAVGCLVLTHYEFRGTREKQRWLLGGFLASAVVYITPFGVLEKVPPPQPPGPPTVAIRHYTVAIPYKDPGIIRYAPMLLRNRSFVRFEKNVEATSVESARAAAVERFLASPESDQVKPKGKTKKAEKVDIDQKELLVVER